MLLPLVYGIFGLIIGSFLNVLILRKNVLSLGGRSECMSCRTTLAWYDMVPVFSWLYLRGRCRACGSSISGQYPLVEAATAALFALIGGTYDAFDPLFAVLALLITSVLIAITVYDIRHTIIPDSWAYFFAACAFVLMFVTGVPPEVSPVLYILSGPVAALPISILWFISKGQWIGLGDAKLSLGIGWLLGPLYGVAAVFFAFVIGAVVSVFILMPLPTVIAWLRKKGIVRFHGTNAQLTMKSEVPFGPFLIASCFIVWFSLLYNIPLPL